MAKGNFLAYAFNRGILSPLAQARTDLKIQALSAEDQTNWMPRELGPMIFRPGLQYIDSTLSNAKAFYIPFIFSVTDTALLEVTGSGTRVRVNEQAIRRVSVGTAITNGNFTTDLSGWMNEDQTGCLSAWAAGPYMSLTGNGHQYAISSQQVTVSGGDIGTEHGIRIVVARGYVLFRAGSADGLDDYIAETTLGPGTHSLALTPSGNFWIRLYSSTPYASLVSSCTIEPAGVMVLPTPWAAADLGFLRSDQSADIIFVACEKSTDGIGYPQYKFERRSKRSWSIVLYQADDGPFELGNLGPVSLTPSAINGDITLTASQPLFYPGHLGALFRITSIGQNVQSSLSANGTFTNPVKVTGLTAQRGITLTISGTWAGTLKLQQSVGAIGAWVDVASYTGNTSTTYNDSLDNQIIYYRLGFDSGYGSGTAVCQLQVASGSITGIARVRSYTDNQHVSASVLTDFGGITASIAWSQGQWSGVHSYPTATGLYEGRLFWVGRDAVNGSVSDAYDSYDDTVIGDSGPISRTIGSGPVDTIAWVLSLQRLLLGGEAQELSVRSSSLEETLTSNNYNVKSPSTRGSAKVGALKIDTNGVFMQRGDPGTSNTLGTRLIQMAYQGTYAVVDYSSTDLSLLAPELTEVGITKIVVQRQPDTRIHCIRTDGKVAVLIYDPIENIKCWVLVETTGTVEDAVVLPGGTEDKVYYTVNRTLSGGTTRCFERWAMESECQGGSINKNSDCHTVIQNGSPSTAISAPQLAGQTVTVWADGKDVGTNAAGNQIYTLDGSGNATLAVAATNVVVGLPYTAQFKSAKLAFAAQAGTALTMKKSIDQIGVILSNTHAQGLKYGRDFNNLYPIPLNMNGVAVDPNYIWPALDADPFAFAGSWDVDSRLCLQAQSPRPCTILAAVIGMQTVDVT